MVRYYRSKSRNHMAKTTDGKNPRGSPKQNGPQKFKSGFEAKGAAYLEALGIPVLYETQKIKYRVPPKDRNYIPDFTLPNGIICEFKGKLDRDTREKMALVIEQNPDKDIRLLFMRNNKISKVSNTKYSDWCEKRSIKYHVSEQGNVPREWLDETGPAKSLSLDPAMSASKRGAGSGKRRGTQLDTESSKLTTSSSKPIEYPIENS